MARRSRALASVGVMRKRFAQAMLELEDPDVELLMAGMGDTADEVVDMFLRLLRAVKGNFDTPARVEAICERGERMQAERFPRLVRERPEDVPTTSVSRVVRVHQERANA